MVVSSINQDGKPESATVAFTEDDRLRIVFGTSSLSRKSQNILQNKHISVVVTDLKSSQTVQLEGTAQILEANNPELENYQALHFAKNPFSAKYKTDPTQCWVLIEPNWIRYTNISSFPWQVEEINL